MASILFWNSFLAAFMLAIMAPMFPTMEAKMSTPTRKSMVTNAYLRGYHLMSDAQDTELEKVKYKFKYFYQSLIKIPYFVHRFIRSFTRY